MFHMHALKWEHKKSPLDQTDEAQECALNDLLICCLRLLVLMLYWFCEIGFIVWIADFESNNVVFGARRTTDQKQYSMRQIEGRMDNNAFLHPCLYIAHHISGFTS